MNKQLSSTRSLLILI